MPSDAMDQIAMHRNSNASPVLAPKRSKSHLKVSSIPLHTLIKSDLTSLKKRMWYINTDTAIRQLHITVDLISLQFLGITPHTSAIHLSKKRMKKMKSNYHPHQQTRPTPTPAYILQLISIHIVKHQQYQ